VSKYSLGRLGLLLASLLGAMSLFSSSALASGPPIVTVGAASNLRLHTATANGTVDKNGAASASVKIEYGKTKLYGKSVTLSAVTGAGAVPVSTILVGLEPVTTYHYRISATNSFGTTVSEDMLFEMLLQWKVAEKGISEYAKPVEYSAVKMDWGLTGEGTTPGGTAVKVTCAPTYIGEGGKSDWARGTLGVSYHFPFTGCKTFLNGNESKPCTPTFSVLDLNAVLMTVKGQTMALGEECSIGESLSLPSGFGLGPMSEAKEQAITLSEKAGFMTFTISSPTWKVVGFYEGLKFGIS
jgi:hypothetical protein